MWSARAGSYQWWCGRVEEGGRERDALVQVVLVLLALAATAGGAVELVAEAAEEAAAAAGWLVGGLLRRDLALCLLTAADHVLESVHD